MEKQNCLGIYLCKETATVVCLESSGGGRKVVGCFSVSVEDAEEPDIQSLAGLIAEGCAERGLKYSEAFVALDCAMFMQHKVHSEFNDAKQISATIRFDAEEALATDVSDIAIAFKISSSSERGSELDVFTAQRQILTDIIVSLQNNNIDPVAIKPDVSCLSQFIEQNVPSSEDDNCLYGILSDKKGYFIAGSDSQDSLVVRTFLLGSKRNRAGLLSREIPITTALIGDQKPISCIKIYDSASSIDYQQLGEKFGIKLDGINLSELAKVAPEMLSDCREQVGFAIAYGAAVGRFDKVQSLNFRNDHMPYLGRQRRLQRIAMVLSILVTIFVIGIGVSFQIPLHEINKNRSKLREKLAEDYTQIMVASSLPSNMSTAKNKLMREYKRIRDIQSGKNVRGEESIPTKLTRLFEAFNKVASGTKLKIETITITSKTIKIIGSTSSWANTIKLRKAIEETGLNVVDTKRVQKDNLDTFGMTLAPARAAKATRSKRAKRK